MKSGTQYFNSNVDNYILLSSGKGFKICLSFDVNHILFRRINSHKNRLCFNYIWLVSAARSERSDGWLALDRQDNIVQQLMDYGKQNSIMSWCTVRWRFRGYRWCFFSIRARNDYTSFIRLCPRWINRVCRAVLYHEPRPFPALSTHPGLWRSTRKYYDQFISCSTARVCREWNDLRFQLHPLSAITNTYHIIIYRYTIS